LTRVSRASSRTMTTCVMTCVIDRLAQPAISGPPAWQWSYPLPWAPFGMTVSHMLASVCQRHGERMGTPLAHNSGHVEGHAWRVGPAHPIG
jgi:hypothetical protein